MLRIEILMKTKNVIMIILNQAGSLLLACNIFNQTYTYLIPVPSAHIKISFINKLCFLL